MARPKEEQDGNLWPSEEGELLKIQVLVSLLDTVFSLERDACQNLLLSAEQLKTRENELLTREMKRSQDTAKKHKPFYTED